MLYTHRDIRCIELCCERCKADGKQAESVHMLHLVPVGDGVAERGAAPQASKAQDHDAGPPGPHLVGAGGPRLRQPAAGLPQERHRDRHGAGAAADARQPL